MSEDAGHGDVAVTPGRTEGEVETVVLDILIASDGSLVSLSACIVFPYDHPRLTVLNWPPLRCWATDLAIAGFSATQRIFVIISALEGVETLIYLSFHDALLVLLATVESVVD